MASFVSVKPNLSYHLVSTEPSGRVTAIEDIGQTPIRINGGFFIFKREIFDHMQRRAKSWCVEPFQRLVRQRRLAAYEYDGFWMSMDTFKDRQQLEEIYARGNAPWEVWNDERRRSRRVRRRSVRRERQPRPSERLHARAEPREAARTASRSSASARIPTTSRSAAAA